MTTFTVSCNDPICTQLINEGVKYNMYDFLNQKHADVGMGDSNPLVTFKMSPERKLELMQQFVNRECYQHDSSLERVSTRTKTI